MEKKFDLKLQLTESQLDELLDALSSAESKCKDLADDRYDSACNYGDFLRAKGVKPADDNCYLFFVSEAEIYKNRSWILGDIFDIIVCAVHDSSRVFENDGDSNCVNTL